MKKPFEINAHFKGLVGQYPSPVKLLRVAYDGGDEVRRGIARLWMSEGIPYAFHNCPAVYEAIRSWLGSELEIHPKEISLVGSARLGVSLAPNNFGKPFGEKSDLDLFIVSSSLFEKLKAEFFSWKCDFDTGKIEPNRDESLKKWRDNSNENPERILNRGFIITKFTPNRPNYPTTMKVNTLMEILVERLRATDCAPKPEEASIRCYSSWENFVRQSVLNLKKICEKHCESNPPA